MERAGQTTIDEVLKGWKDSPGHNGNLLLADVEPMGIALVHDPKTVFTAFRALVIAASGWGSGGGDWPASGAKAKSLSLTEL